MTEAELWQVVFLARAHTFSAFNGAMFGISGYLMIAYFVGARLGRFQAVLVSAVFAFYEFVLFFVVNNQMNVPRHYGAVLIRDFGLDFVASGQLVARWAAPLLLFLLIAGSLYFMYQVRRQPTLSAGLSKTGSL